MDIRLCAYRTADPVGGDCYWVIVSTESNRDRVELVRTVSKAARALSSASGSVCRYFWVVMIWAWPMRSMTVLRSAPPASSQEAWAWRRSCMRTLKSMPER